MNEKLSQRAGLAKTGINFFKYGKNWLTVESRFVDEVERAKSFDDLPADIQKMIVDGEREVARRAQTRKSPRQP